MRYTHDTSVPSSTRRLARQICDAVATSGHSVMTEAVVYYGLYRMGVDTDTAAEVVQYLIATDRAQKSGVLLIFRQEQSHGEESSAG